MNKIKKITITDIAEACGVTIGTVSRALNNQPGMRPEVRNNILEYIENIGWKKNSNRSPSQNNQHKQVVLVSNMWDLSNSGFQPMHRAMSHLIKLLDKESISTPVLYGPQSAMLKQCLKQRPQAVVIFCGDDKFHPEIEALLNARIQVLTAFGNHAGQLYPSVLSDNHDLGVKMAKYFSERNCKRYALFAPAGFYSHPADFMRMLKPRYREIISGLLSVDSSFEPARDFISDAFGDPTDFIKAFDSGEYDGLIGIGREIFDIFNHLCMERNITMQQKMMLPVLAENHPWDLVTGFNRFYESGIDIGNQLFKLIQNNFTGSMQCRIPYEWRHATKFGEHFKGDFHG